MSCKLTYAGHSAVMIEIGGKIVAIDPWLEGNPLCPERLKSPAKIDLIVLTHGHSDHASEAAALARKLGCKLAATYELAIIMNQEGVASEKIVFMNKGGTAQIDGLSVTLTHAFHSSSYDSKDGTVYAGEPCGVVLRDRTHSIYHAGDTALFSDMALIGERYQPEVALLPIGDLFTMGPEEAAHAAKLLRCKTAIPIHHSTFPGLTGTPSEFSAACKKLNIPNVAVLAPGESYQLE